MGYRYTEHPTREGKVYCCVVLDAWSRRVVGWSIDSRQRADLATSALDMAIDSRTPPGGGINPRGSLGRREDALAANDQAVTSRRQLAAARPKVFSGDLATSLRVQTSVLDSLDRSIDAAQLRVEADELE